VAASRVAYASGLGPEMVSEQSVSMGFHALYAAVGWLPHGDAANGAYGEQGGCKPGVRFRPGARDGECACL
jgi:hypothetical protein